MDVEGMTFRWILHSGLYTKSPPFKRQHIILRKELIKMNDIDKKYSNTKEVYQPMHEKDGFAIL
jgi:hypothetical protein